MAKLEGMRLGQAAAVVRTGVTETLAYMSFPREHWSRIRTNNVLERLNREIKRRTRVVGANVYGLAQAFLETGAYLLGTRWKIADTPAAAFAPTFCSSFLAHGQPIGEAVRSARRFCKEAESDDFAWASYVLYGDPRLCFKRGEERPSPLLPA